VSRVIPTLLGINKIMVLEWIPGHCNITGNEKADASPKKATLITQTTHREMSSCTVKTTIQKISKMTNIQRLAI
jgi:hypothetical protein